MTSDVSARAEPWFVGCACDRKFVEHTAVMLTSLSINGDIGEATIIVAGFGLNADDRAVLRAGARQMAGRLQFIDITREALREVDRGGFSEAYPPSVLGRLFIADLIDDPGARLLTLDSDMIVNTSLRPLFDLDLRGEFFAAIHDPPRRHDMNYFNSGLTLTKVADYRRHDIAKRSLMWLAEQEIHPSFPDQDALNDVIGDSWHRLDRSWNFFFFEDERFTTEGYEGAKVAHFAGPKPWDYADHPGAPVYNRYLAKLRQQREAIAPVRDAAGRDFVATCYEIFLGRSLDSDGVAFERARWPKDAVVRSIVQSPEFREAVLGTARAGAVWPSYLFIGAPTVRQRFWVADQLPLMPETRAAAETVGSWPELFDLVTRDRAFCQAYDLVD